MICSMSALTRYSAVTPKRPEATCLIAERIESPLGKRLVAVGFLAAFAGVRLAAADAVHRAIASVVCASREMEP